MKILIAPDSFKGWLTALEAASAIGEGVKKALPDAQVDKVPVADGGEGTVQSLVNATGGRMLSKEVTGPLGEPVEASYGILGDGKKAVIEMASASGLPLVPLERRDPSKTTTYGTGELIRAALDEGCRSLIIGIGGSATTDGGAGMAQALGSRLLDGRGEEIGFGGRALLELEKIDISRLHPAIAQSDVVTACDVDNPLCGPQGAAHVYSPQKGAGPEMVEMLDRALSHFADLVKRDLGKSVRDRPGAGAAGGLGAGLIAFLNSELRLGFDIVAETVGLEERIARADLVITGEGKMGGQTLRGKTPFGVAKLANKHGKPVIAVCGSLGEGWEELLSHGFKAIIPKDEGRMSDEEALRRAYELTVLAAEKAIRGLKL